MGSFGAYMAGQFESCERENKELRSRVAELEEKLKQRKSGISGGDGKLTLEDEPVVPTPGPPISDIIGEQRGGDKVEELQEQVARWMARAERAEARVQELEISNTTQRSLVVGLEGDLDATEARVDDLEDKITAAKALMVEALQDIDIGDPYDRGVVGITQQVLYIFSDPTLVELLAKLDLGDSNNKQ